jgi:hypothetical protein
LLIVFRSAYDYILPEDHSIALFAQKLSESQILYT